MILNEFVELGTIAEVGQRAHGIGAHVSDQGLHQFVNVLVHDLDALLGALLERYQLAARFENML